MSSEPLEEPNPATTAAEAALARSGIVRSADIEAVVKIAQELCPDNLGGVSGLAAIALAVAVSRMADPPFLPLVAFRELREGRLFTRGAMSGAVEELRLTAQHLSNYDLAADLDLRSSWELLIEHFASLDNGRTLKAAYPHLDRLIVAADGSDKTAVVVCLHWLPPYWTARIDGALDFGDRLDVSSARTGVIAGAEVDALFAAVAQIDPGVSRMPTLLH